MMDRERRDDDNLPGSLQSLRGEFDGIQEISRERRVDMPQAQVTMDVRKASASEKAYVIDIEGDLTAFSEDVLMDAYNQASDGRVRAIVLNFEGLEYMNSSGIGLSPYDRPNRKLQRAD